MGSRSVSEDPEGPEEPFHIRDRISHEVSNLQQRERNEQRARDGPPRREVFRIGRRTVPSEQESTTPTPRSQTMRTEKEGRGSGIELAMTTDKKGSESGGDVTTTESGSKHSSSQEAQKEGSVNEEK